MSDRRQPPYKTFGAIATALAMVVLSVIYLQFRGDLTPKTRLTLLANRSGLLMDPGSKVTYNGVKIGRIASVTPDGDTGTTRARLLLDVDPAYVRIIPANVEATIAASTVFGNKYVSLRSPKSPLPQRITDSGVIDVSSVTTEFNTLFETVTSIAEKVDPVQLNMTLSATAEALKGLGDEFGDSLVEANDILGELNPRLPQIRRDIQQVGALADVYAAASPDLWNFLDNAVVTARSFNDQQGNLDEALLAAAGFGSSGADIVERGRPYLVRGQADLLPTAQLLDKYSPVLHCMIRNYADIAPRVSDALGSNGYSAVTMTEILGGENPYIYPDNLPRVNAKGGPGGSPGCWQPITRDLWPAPYLVADTGASIAPYNHFELGKPLAIEYVWGRQVGENTINP